MKTKLLLILFFIAVWSTKAFSQFAFGVSPGLGLHSSYLGYQVNDKVIPYVGFQYLNANFKYEEGSDYSYELAGSLYIPNIGVKYFLTQQNKIKSYLSLDLAKPLLGGKFEDDGEEDEDVKETIDNLSMWGGELSFGIEYFFDENFSLGGAFGLRYFHLKYDEKVASESDYGNDSYNFKFNMSPTFSQISLNYYF
ncbi:MAG: hypothetical protein AB2L20_12465 [Mangrovibacterium sp.]